jgi:hypothetical protein
MNTGLRVLITDGFNTAYRIGVQRGGPEFEVVPHHGHQLAVPGLKQAPHYISAAAVNRRHHQSVQSRVRRARCGHLLHLTITSYGLDCWGIGIPEVKQQRTDALLSAHPNQHQVSPRSHRCAQPARPSRGHLEIFDAQGRAVDRVPFRLVPGANTVAYMPRHGSGAYMARLMVDGRLLGSEQVVVVRE